MSDEPSRMEAWLHVAYSVDAASERLLVHSLPQGAMQMSRAAKRRRKRVKVGSVVRVRGSRGRAKVQWFYADGESVRLDKPLADFYSWNIHDTDLVVVTR